MVPKNLESVKILRTLKCVTKRVRRFARGDCIVVLIVIIHTYCFRIVLYKQFIKGKRRGWWSEKVERISETDNFGSERNHVSVGS